jgi:hypothetical protein
MLIASAATGDADQLCAAQQVALDRCPQLVTSSAGRQLCQLGVEGRDPKEDAVRATLVVGLGSDVPDLVELVEPLHQLDGVFDVGVARQALGQPLGVGGDPEHDPVGDHPGLGIGIVADDQQLLGPRWDAGPLQRG